MGWFPLGFVEDKLLNFHAAPHTITLFSHQLVRPQASKIEGLDNTHSNSPLKKLTQFSNFLPYYWMLCKMMKLIVGQTCQLVEMIRNLRVQLHRAIYWVIFAD